ncbi:MULTISPECIES: hypothetical protein [Staphylococcus]|mgnify:FL=1|uniref:hypothetical protein n=1 Tax=Staphylococcus TaxID=1279 RepID=UPI00119DDD34|nr:MULTISPECIES: hypothetical protein [Staphylococcus]MCH4401707.1 hypothetical protein [Staphylococcus haemolyticus]MEC5376777.1 hypothetical protein [Staphylococcus hominis]MEC5415282.1 hypothetical protein [Staphylococcus hominis]
MHIKKIYEQTRRDFRAIYECEHCGYTKDDTGYDDLNFHNNVVPDMVCDKCKRKADETYRPLQPKYPEDMQI